MRRGGSRAAPTWKEKSLSEDLKEFTLEELSQYNGADGKPVYLAYRGRVYDVSDSSLWQGGEHMAGHFAGADLTGELPDAPHGAEVFTRYPQVGVLAAAPETPEARKTNVCGPPPPEFLLRLLQRFPMLKRHPHPMLVHFPVVFFISAPVFAILYLLTGVSSFETTAFNCLGGGVLFTPPVLITGLLTWWFNYELCPLRPVTIKLILTPILLALGTGAFVWRWLNPEVLTSPGPWVGKVYLFLLCLSAVLVGLIGWYGASLTFPLHEE
jgi:predicted heme/steroid binding protein/uncharacterized membrane protein